MAYSVDKHVGSIHAVDALVHASVSYYRNDTPQALTLLQAAKELVASYIEQGINDPKEDK